MMTFHFVMHLMMRGFLKFFPYLMTSYYLMTGFVVKLVSSFGLGYTGKQQAGGNEYGKFRVHDLCFFNCWEQIVLVYKNAAGFVCLFLISYTYVKRAGAYVKALFPTSYL